MDIQTGGSRTAALEPVARSAGIPAATYQPIWQSAGHSLLARSVPKIFGRTDAEQTAKARKASRDTGSTTLNSTQIV